MTRNWTDDEDNKQPLEQTWPNQCVACKHDTYAAYPVTLYDVPGHPEPGCVVCYKAECPKCGNLKQYTDAAGKKWPGIYWPGSSRIALCSPAMWNIPPVLWQNEPDEPSRKKKKAEIGRRLRLILEKYPYVHNLTWEEFENPQVLEEK